jgi:uncharacterized protein (UPF0335 family)
VSRSSYHPSASSRPANNPYCLRFNPLERIDPVAYSPRLNPEPEFASMAEGTVAADQLRLFIERIERLEEEKKAMSDDIRDVYAEAKANGYDTKTMRAIVRLRRLETHVRQEADALLETYRAALGLA